MSDTLTQALEHPANDLRDLYTEHYPEARIVKKRTQAAWRGSKEFNVLINDRTMHDFVSGETYNAFSFLTEIVGYSKKETATYLIDRAGISNEKTERPAITEARRAQLEAERAERERDRAEQERLETARKAETFEAALKTWHHLPVATSHPYLRRKKLEGHMWPDVRQDGSELRIALRNPSTGDITGIQRITADGKKLMVEGSVKVGSAIFVTGTPTEQVCQIVLTEGFADAGSCALARQSEQHVVAAIDAANLTPVYYALKARWPHAEIIIASDDDDGTALKTDKSGKQLENVGQVKAHTLALEVGCKVAVPHLPGKTGTNVDFSDVYAELGPVEVERQLAAAGYAKAEFAKTDLDDKSFLHGYKLAQTYGCSVTVSRERHLEPLDLEPGITALRALMGTGKTEAVAQWLRAHPELKTLAVSHLRGLTADLAGRLSLTDYRDIPSGRERDYRQSAFCVNSLWRLVDPRDRVIRPVDVLFADEIKQLLHRLTSRKDFADKRQCLAVLEYLVRSARYVIVADAHVDHTVMRWLKRLRPDDAPHMVLSTYQPGVGRTIYRHLRKGDVRAAARDALIAGRNVYYASNGLERVKEVEGWLKNLKDELPDLRTLLVCSETAAEERVRAFFTNPKDESKKYDLIVASPSVATGVSIDNGHFDVVCGEYSARVGTPNDALQSLSRVRSCPELHVWVETRRANLVTHRETIQSAFWDAPSDDKSMADIDPVTGVMTVEQSYAELYLDVKVAEHKAINTYTTGFWDLVDEDGYTVHDGAGAEDATEIETQARAATKEARIQKLLEADDLTDQEAGTLRRASTTRTLTQAESYALERYDLMQFYRLPVETPDDELRAVIESDRERNLRRELSNLELTATSADEIATKMNEQVERDTLKPDMTRYDHRHAAWRAVLKIAGVNLKTFEATGEGYDEATLREQWIKPLETQWETYRVSVPAWPELRHAKSQPLRAFGKVLRGAFGLNHKRTGRNAGGVYTISDRPLETRREWIAKRKDGEGSKTAGTDNLLYKETHTVTSVPVESVLAETAVTSNTAHDADSADREIFSNYTGDYERLWQTLTTGLLQDDGYFNSLRESCEQATQGNLPAQWYVDAALKQPEVQRRLGLT